ncbi:nitrous oxide reductase accessory protein NosL [Chitinophaga parva]|nr:nitrous oxide reductase accessory protein NosL [Chitinophaga parva]
MKQLIWTGLVAGIAAFTSCKQGPQPIRYGYDACTHCKMTIVDKRFAAEIVTRKGRAYPFDDIACMVDYIKAGRNSGDVAAIYVSDYNKPDGSFMEASQAVFFYSEKFNSPMNGNYAAFSQGASAPPADSTLKGPLKWERLLQ